MRVLVILFTLAAGLWGCAASGGTGAPLPDMHNSRNSLSWAGLYEGVLPCADCPGIKTRLTLRRDGSYERVSETLERPAPPRTARGQFSWNAAGGAITLDAAGGGQAFTVGEGRLLLLDAAGKPVATGVLTQVRVD